MSVCVRSGVRYRRHNWLQEEQTCYSCGAKSQWLQFQEEEAKNAEQKEPTVAEVSA